MLSSYGVSVAKALFQISPNRELYIPVTNHRQSVTRLPEEMELGRLDIIDDLTLPVPPELTNREKSLCAHVAASDCDDRRKALKSNLNVSRDTVSPCKFHKFEDFLLQNKYVFALSNEELGCTEALAHSIDWRHCPYPSATVSNSVLTTTEYCRTTECPCLPFQTSKNNLHEALERCLSVTKAKRHPGELV